MRSFLHALATAAAVHLLCSALLSSPLHRSGGTRGTLRHAARRGSGLQRRDETAQTRWRKCIGNIGASPHAANDESGIEGETHVTHACRRREHQEHQRAAESSKHKQQLNFCLLRMHAQAVLITLNHLSSSAANCNLRHRKKRSTPCHMAIKTIAPCSCLFSPHSPCIRACRDALRRVWRDFALLREEKRSGNSFVVPPIAASASLLG